MSEWQDVPQDYRRQQQRRALTTRMCLLPLGSRGSSAAIINLWVTIPPDGLATLGSAIGTDAGHSASVEHVKLRKEHTT